MNLFDFSAPISITVIIEESNDELPDKNNRKGQGKNLNSKCDKKLRGELFNDQTALEKTSISIENDAISADTSTEMGKSPISTTAKQNLCSKEICDDKENKAKCKGLCTNNSIVGISKIFSSVNDRQGWAMYVMNLLDKVSTGLILVMRAYYYDSSRRYKTLQQFKNHIYSSSHSTTESIILPNEKNKIFIEKFIDMTVTNAIKVLGWKCERKHVKPFYDEMIAWSKRKMYQMEEASGNTVISKDRKNTQIVNKNNNINSNDNIDEEVIFIEDSTQKKRDSKDIRYSKIETKKNSKGKLGVHSNKINKKEVIVDSQTRQNKNHGSRINKINTVLVENTFTNCQVIEDNVKSQGINKKGKNDKINENEEGKNDVVINNNKKLIDQLVAPLRPVNFSHSTVATASPLNLNAHNSTCIFSYGPPGQEVSINIGKDTLVYWSSKQSCNLIGNNTTNVVHIIIFVLGIYFLPFSQIYLESVQ